MKEESGGDSAYPLMLLTSKTSRHFLNSSRAGLAKTMKAEGEQRLNVHPTDASARGIGDGEMVRVFNTRGSMKIRARISDRPRPGIVTLPHGYWASRMPGGSSTNAVTRDGLTDLGGGGDFYDTRVQMENA